MHSSQCFVCYMNYEWRNNIVLQLIYFINLKKKKLLVVDIVFIILFHSHINYSLYEEKKIKNIKAYIEIESSTMYKNCTINFTISISIYFLLY